MTTNFPSCDGIRRRDWLKIGAASTLGFSLSLPSLLERRATAAQNAPRGTRPARDVSLLIIYLQGGMSTIDAFDLKPEAPAEFRGDFRPIDTKSAGMQICEHLPTLAMRGDKFSLLRSFTHNNSGHGSADHYMLTGYNPSAAFNPNLKPNNERPSHGSIMARKLGPRGAVPPYVSVLKMHNSAGPAYLGASAAPFVAEGDPNTPGFTVPDLSPPMTVDAGRLNHRRALLDHVDRYRRRATLRANAAAKTVTSFQQKAFELMTSEATRAAFDISAERDSLREEYGRHTLGQSCLLARRLLEAGTRCAMVTHNNWDTHSNNFHILKTVLLPQLNSGLGTLLRDLSDRGLLETTLVVAMGEFGRTPRINSNAGRDHWGPANTLLVAGGGIAGGRVVGRTNEHGERPASDPAGPEDLAATIHHCLGINPEDEFHTPEGRPIKIVNNGRVIKGLI
ncbi:MAG TPA: DUF1501 domain-containing protein [Planctomycetaceae bacterium]|jgi:hypothetical protein|nr:DUF1501 domain-containing protein [Planctomycetaceae bacterium]